MKNKWLILISVVFLYWSCDGQTKKINGISFVASSNKINQDNIMPIKKVSANYVTLMPFGFIKDLNSPKITFNSSRQWFGETEKGIEQYSTEFRKNDIKVMLKPQIWVWRGEYTGFIKMNSEENWKILEASYSDFILTYAKLAQKINAEILCIGTELEKFVENRPNYWSKLVFKIRKIYKGKLTYAANWDEFKRVPFWGDVDFIGIDAYFPLSTKKSPTIQDFIDGWQSHKNQIIKVREKVNKPVLFTEFGYRSVHYTGKEPWNSDRVEGNVDLKNQSNALEAIYQQFWKENWFAGGFLWKWFHDHAKVGGVKNNRFTPQNKPAELIIKKAYEQ
ncbi:glycoside hydrolase family 113 [Tenacibaculum halocynthiae]|uniref:glycoside hydrolase family 113 n=1 Tax=Tenacibaculum halocynthiae TaxID=1254437 RepID=UPI003D64A582